MKLATLLIATLSILPVFGALAAPEVKVIALFTDKALLQVGDQQKVVSKGETFEGVLLQSASGRGAVVVIDGETYELGLNRSVGANYKKRDASSLRIYADSHGMYYSEGTINGQFTRFLVDTGATYVTLSGRKARQLKIDYRKGIPSTAQTASSIVPVWQIRLDSISIGDIEVRNVDATVIAGDRPTEVLLGNSFLKHTHMQNAGSVLELKKRF